MADLERVHKALKLADSYLDVFGECEGDKSLQTKHIKKVYRQIARVVHPDTYRNDKATLAAEAFVLLQQYEKEASAAIENGSYGDTAQATVETKLFLHKIGRLIAGGDIADILASESLSKRDGRHATPTVLKVARSSRDSDLIQAEARALKQLRNSESDPKLHVFAPRLLQSLKLVRGKQRLSANVIERLVGFYTLEEVRDAYPDGVEPLDMAWIWRRLLVAIGFAHEQQVVHGAVWPSHVMILPERHGLVLVDWSYSTIVKDESVQTIKAVVPKYRNLYPQEVVNKEIPTFGTDVYMAAKTMVYLLGGDPLTMHFPKSVPKAFRAYFRGCVSSNQHARPQNAWALLKEFDELLERQGAPYYPRCFKPFVMP